MKTWDSLAEAAADLQISERTAWRWLRSGRIAKSKNKDGRLVFALASDITHNATDSHDMSDTAKSVSTIIEPNRRYRKKMSIEAQRTSIGFDCLNALYILKTEAAAAVRFYQGMRKIHWIADRAQEGMILWMEIEKLLNNVYVGINEGLRGKDELKKLWSDLLEARTAWDREQSAQVQELEMSHDRQSQLQLKFVKAELKNQLAQFDLALEGLKQLLILAVEDDSQDR